MADAKVRMKHPKVKDKTEDGRTVDRVIEVRPGGVEARKRAGWTVVEDKATAQTAAASKKEG